MQKSIKIPLLAVLVIMSLFVFQSYVILSLSKKDEISQMRLEMMKFQARITDLFLQNKSMPESLIYQYAILNDKKEPIFSTITTLPESLQNFEVIDNTIYYQNFFFKNGTPHFIVVSTQINVKREVFIIALMMSFIMIVVVGVMYLSYFSTIRPYKQAQKYLNDFFNDAMHELKTPLGVAKINLEMLEIKNKNTNRIANALKQMQLAYDDVEFFIKRGYIKFPKEHLDLSQFVRERIRFLSSLADVKRIKLVNHATISAQINISKMELSRLVDNTITNAIKYSPQDSQVIVDLRVDEGSATLSVQDFGIGIKDVAKIFRRYEREDSVQGGFGIGLNIVREICKQNNISYRVDTQLGKGSTFFYEFRLDNDKLN